MCICVCVCVCVKVRYFFSFKQHAPKRCLSYIWKLKIFCICEKKNESFSDNFETSFRRAVLCEDDDFYYILIFGKGYLPHFYIRCVWLIFCLRYGCNFRRLSTQTVRRIFVFVFFFHSTICSSMRYKIIWSHL